MVGKDPKCPRCGRLISYGDKCQKCGLSNDEAIIYRQRRRKRRSIIAIASLCIIITFLLLAPSIIDWLRSPSQKYLVTSADLGDGWKVSGPHRHTIGLQGVSDAAFINIDSLNMKGSCWLYAHSTTELAKASYETIIRDRISDWSPIYESIDIPGTDRAVIFTTSSTIAPENERMIVFEKGTWVIDLMLFNKDLSRSDPSGIIKVAEVQAAKIP